MTSSKVDQQLIAHWTTQPEDWLAELLKRFGQEQMQFRAVLPVLRLGRLMEKMNIDLASIKAGQDTINKMTFKDWTVKYNLRNFQTILDAGGDKFSGSTPRDPIAVPPFQPPWRCIAAALVGPINGPSFVLANVRHDAPRRRDKAGYDMPAVASTLPFRQPDGLARPVPCLASYRKEPHLFCTPIS
jgi:hypothetical protein